MKKNETIYPYDEEGLVIKDNVLVEDQCKHRREVLTIPKSVKSIKNGIYDGNASIEKVVFLSSVSLPWNAFTNCSELKEIIALKNVKFESCKSIYACPKLESVKIAGSFQFSKKEIGYRMFFEQCPKLVKNGFVIIEDMLIGCYPERGIETVVLPDGIRSIAPNAFKSAGNLLLVDLRDEVEELQAYAFAHSKVREITGTAKLKTIDDYAFDGSEVEKFNYPDGVKFGKDVFKDCRNLTDEKGLLILDSKLLAFNSEKHCNYMREHLNQPDSYIVALPFGVNSIEGSFLNAPGRIMDEVVIPNSLNRLNPENFFVRGFNSFKIVDEYGNVLADESFISNSPFIHDDTSFRKFCKKYSSDYRIKT